MTVEYACKRCGYTTHIRTIYSNHLKKKKPCKPILSNIETCVLIEELDNYIISKLKTGIKLPIEKKCVGNALGCVGNALECVEDALECVEDALEYSGKVSECVPEIIHTCKHCNKIFKDKRYLTQHYKRYKKCEIFQNNQNNQDNQIDENHKILKLEKEIEQLKERNNVLLKSQSQVTNINNNNNKTNNITNNITLSTYGTEDFSYIAQDLLKSFQFNPYESIPKLVGLIHFNPKHPENHNVKWINVNKNWIQRYEGKKKRLDKSRQKRSTS